jgi:hypothetical protein
MLLARLVVAAAAAAANRNGIFAIGCVLAFFLIELMVDVECDDSACFVDSVSLCTGSSWFSSCFSVFHHDPVR